MLGRCERCLTAEYYVVTFVIPFQASITGQPPLRFDQSSTVLYPFTVFPRYLSFIGCIPIRRKMLFHSVSALFICISAFGVIAAPQRPHLENAFRRKQQRARDLVRDATIQKPHLGPRSVNSTSRFLNNNTQSSYHFSNIGDYVITICQAMLSSHYPKSTLTLARCTLD